MKNDWTDWLIPTLCIILSFLIASITTTVTLEKELQPYKELKKELNYVKDSISIQHNTYKFVIPKDTIINQTIKIECVK